MKEGTVLGKKVLAVIVAGLVVTATVAIVWLVTPGGSPLGRSGESAGLPMGISRPNPAGTHIVIDVRPQMPRDPRDLAIVDLEEGNVQRFGCGSFPSWSPDGTRIWYFGKGAEGDGELGTWEFDLRNQATRRIDWLSVRALRVVWSPVEELLLISSIHCAPPPLDSCLTVARPDGSDQRRLLRRPGCDHFPKWGPEGRYIYSQGYSRGESDSDTGREIVRICVEDGHIETLVRGSLGYEFYLSGDGTQLVYFEQVGTPWQPGEPPTVWGRLWLLDTLTLAKIPVPCPPGEIRLCTIAFSPKGDAVVVPDDEGRLWRVAIPSGETVLVAEKGRRPVRLPKPGQGFVYFRQEQPMGPDSDILMYHSDDAGTEQRLVAGF